MERVLFLVGGLGNGGAERVALTLADGLWDKGYLVDVFYFREDKKIYGSKCPVKLIKKGGPISTVIYLRKCIKQISPDIVIAFEYHTAVKCVLSSCFQKRTYKLIASERNDPGSLKENKLFMWDILRRYAYGKCNCVVFQTQDAKAYFPAKILKHSAVILNPVSGQVPKWRIGKSESSVIAFCRLERQKNIPLLLDAFQQVLKDFPQYRLHIYGNGSMEEDIRRDIAKRGMQQSVDLLPFDKDIHNIAVRSRLYVSSSDYEGMSNSMLEAMAMGMPVVCTDCPIGGARMVIEDHENGILVPVKNSGCLAQAMREIISDDVLAVKLGKNAGKIRQDLSLEIILQKWIALL